MQHQSSTIGIAEEVRVAACEGDKFSGVAGESSPAQQRVASEEACNRKEEESAAREASLEQQTTATEELTVEVSSCEGEDSEDVASDVPPEQEVVAVLDSGDPEFEIIERDLRTKQQNSGSPVGDRGLVPASFLDVDELTKVRLAKQVSQATAPGVYVESDSHPKPSHEQLQRIGNLRLMQKDRQSRHGNPEEPLPEPTDEPVSAVLLDDFQERMNDFRIKEDQVIMVEDEDLSDRRKWSLIAIVVGIALVGVGVVVGIILGRGGGQTSNTEVQAHGDVDTTATVPYNDTAAKAFNECLMRNDTIPSDGFLQLKGRVSSALRWNSGQIDAAGSIQRAAICWLSDDKSLEETGVVQAATYEVMQRFALATIYYHFVGTATQLGSTGLSASNWLDYVHVCLWDFVACDSSSNRVTELLFDGLTLDSPMLDEIALLSDLVSLKVTWSHLTGQIPPSLSALTGLEVLDLRGNDLTGTLPSELGGLPELREIQFGYNNIEGEIPPQLFQLPKLHSLFLQGNSLTGTLPSALQNATDLTGLLVGHNHLVGTIPDISRLTKLELLDLSSNWIEDSFPDISLLTNLVLLNLVGIRLTGAIPSAVWRFPKLEIIDLHNTKDVSGTIPTEVGLLTNLYILRLGATSITGSIPSTFGNLSSTLRLLDLNPLKGLSGTIPTELGRLSRLVELYLPAESHLVGGIPDEVCDLRGGELVALIDPINQSGQGPSLDCD